MELNEKLIEAIIMSATCGQFSQQLVEETFSQMWTKFDEGKKQLYNVLVSGGGALTTYLLTQEQLQPKAADVALLSGIFATTTLKLLKKKNESAQGKTSALVAKLDDQDKLEKDLKIKELEEKIEKLVAEK